MLYCRFCASNQANFKFEIQSLKSHTRGHEPRNRGIIVLRVTKQKRANLSLKFQILTWPFLRAFARKCR
jgi:hypothetical protein